MTGRRSHGRLSALNGVVHQGILQSLSDRWSAGSADREDLIRLLEKLKARGLTTGDVVFTAARECLLAPAETIGDFRAAANFCEAYPVVVSNAERDVLKDQFADFASDYASGWDSDSDPDWLREVAGDLENLGSRLGVDAEEYTQDLYEKADEVEAERAEEEPPDDYDREDWERTDTFLDDIEGMFDGLESDLRNT